MFISLFVIYLFNINKQKQTEMNKQELIKQITIEIENLQFDLQSDWIEDDQKRKGQTINDLNSLKTVLGHIITLQTF